MHLDLLRSFRRPSQAHVPGHVRKIWLAKELFPGGDGQPHDGQSTVHEGGGVRVLCGFTRLRTRAHPLFAEGMTTGEVSLMVWVAFDRPFFEPPVVHADLQAPCGSRFRLEAGSICEDGFQITAHRLGDHRDDEITVFWRATGITQAFSAAAVPDDLL